MVLHKIRHAFKEKQGFSLFRPNGTDDYILIHFWKPVYMLYRGEYILTKPNAVILYSKQSVQHYYSPNYDFVHDWLHMDGDVPEQAARYDLQFDTLYYPQDCSFITELCAILENEYFGGESYSDDVVDNTLRTMFALLARNLQTHEKPLPIDFKLQNAIKELRGEIMSSLGKDWSVAQMAKHVNTSESRFFLLYKQLYGVTPTKDIILNRLNYAKTLLTQNQDSVSDIAEKCGYQNQFHFIRQFKEYTGMTPKQYALNRSREAVVADHH